MDFDSVAAIKSMLGSGGVVVMDEDTCMVKAALRIMRFYAHESCGWCIPCREGTTWLRKLLQRFHDGMGTRSDIVLIGDLSKNMLGRTFCPAGRCGRDADDRVLWKSSGTSSKPIWTGSLARMRSRLVWWRRRYGGDKRAAG